jgi:cytochrome c551/c552
MRPRHTWFLPALALTLIVVGLVFGGQTSIAKGAPAAQATPDPATTAAFAKAGCAGCHTIPGVANAVGLVGPNLSKIGAEAGSRKPAMSVVSPSPPGWR